MTDFERKPEIGAVSQPMRLLGEELNPEAAVQYDPVTEIEEVDFENDMAAIQKAEDDAWRDGFDIRLGGNAT